MDGVLRQHLRPSSYHANVSFITASSTSLPTSVIQTVNAAQYETPACDSNMARVHNHVKTVENVQNDVVLDLSTTPHRHTQSNCQRQQSGPPSDSSASEYLDMYRRYLDDLKRLDELIERRTYERNMLSWRCDRAKRSLERLLQPVKYIHCRYCKQLLHTNC